MSDDQFEELAIGHLLGELDVSGEIALQEELASRGTPGHATVRELRETLGVLALAVAPADPPNALRARVLWSAGAPVHPPDVPVAAPRSFWAWAIAALMAAVAVGLGVWAGRLADERTELRDSVRRLAQRAAASDSAAAIAAADLDIAGGGGSSVRELRGSIALPGASGRLFLAEDGRGLLLASGLPPLSPGRVYALWTMDAEGARPAGVFRPDAAGRGRLEIGDLALAPDAALAVTEEPGPDVERPTGRVLLTSG
jgi:hypothetical protein